MRNWVIATIVAASVGGGGAVYYVVSESPPPAAGPSADAATAKSADSAAASPAKTAAPAVPSTVESAAVAPAAVSKASTALRFEITVKRTDKPGLDTAWTAVCPREALLNRVNGCRVDDRKGMVEGASAIAVYDDGGGRIGFVRDLSMTGLALSRGASVWLPNGVDYPVTDAGTHNWRWAIPTDHWKKGVSFTLNVHRLKSTAGRLENISENVGRAKIVLLD